MGRPRPHPQLLRDWLAGLGSLQRLELLRQYANGWVFEIPCGKDAMLIELVKATPSISVLESLDNPRINPGDGLNREPPFSASSSDPTFSVEA